MLWNKSLTALLVLSLAGALSPSGAQRGTADEITPFLQLLSLEKSERDQALAHIEAGWQSNYTAMLVELLSYIRAPATGAGAIALLQQKTGQRFGADQEAWFQWLWNRPPDLHPHYADFKAGLYKRFDRRFRRYFSASRPATIRLDEVRWGGVKQDGIPPLRHPAMISAPEATYLQDDNLVFGIEINGDARAYPKRILGWHEMFADEVGGVPVAGVYCTLCGTMILYQTQYKGTRHRLGTSGFLYRSNKLMYDRTTQSLWSTLWGRPVIGPLVGAGIELPRLYLVTSTWGEWRRRHPETQVLSLDTGYGRDYSEGAAYHEYFATDELMFGVPKLDKRLKNKDEVLGLVFGGEEGEPLAISVQYLAAHSLYQDRVGKRQFVALTDHSGAIRVYETRGLNFVQWDRDQTVVDARGVSWTLSESRLTSADGHHLARLPAHRAFWFGWYSAYENTRLVH